MVQTESRKAAVQDGGVDILELMAILWRGRWIIISASVVMAIISVLWLSFQKDVYRVNAIISSADSFMVESLQPSMLKPLIADSGAALEPQYKNLQQHYQVRDLEGGRLFSIALESLNGGVAAKAYWELKNDRSLNLDSVSSDDYQSYLKFIDRLSWGKVDPVKGGGVQLVLMASDPASGVNELSEYIQFLSDFSVERTVSRIRGGLGAKLGALNRDYDMALEQESVREGDRLVQLREAAVIAKELGILDTPYSQVTGVELSILDNRLYLLGERALAAEIQMLERRESPESFVSVLRGMQTWKRQISQDLERYANGTELYAFSLLREPTSTPYPVKPRRILVVLGGIFLGGAIGVLLILGRQGVRVYRSRK